MENGQNAPDSPRAALATSSSSTGASDPLPSADDRTVSVGGMSYLEPRCKLCEYLQPMNMQIVIDKDKIKCPPSSKMTALVDALKSDLVQVHSSSFFFLSIA